MSDFILAGLAAAVFAFLYFSRKRALKKLAEAVADKRRTGAGVLLTQTTDDKTLSALTDEINQLFQELQAVKMASQQEKAMFDMALHNMTHDIRTPLTIASGYTQTLMKEDANDTLLKIKQNLDTVSGRLEILLDYQNLLETENKPDLVPVNLTEILKNELLNAYDQLTEKKIAVDFVLEADYFVLATRVILKRIVQNLLGNVLKHGKNHLSVRLTADNTRVTLRLENQSQQPIRKLNKLTNRFYSENLSASENSSGLGLYIARELVERTNGNFALAYQTPDFSVSLSWPRLEN
ncbi:MAG: HAMP domain-containing histidine kinase [Streptococcaceae bacterium]|jgi:signal transduction histidine kinase|nr:HAMP domain-containing histidine kinase [Streptococcaceae bacterium]